LLEKKDNKKFKKIKTLWNVYNKNVFFSNRAVLDLEKKYEKKRTQQEICYVFNNISKINYLMILKGVEREREKTKNGTKFRSFTRSNKFFV
jgi:hypothetical protein